MEMQFGFRFLVWPWNGQNGGGDQQINIGNPVVESTLADLLADLLKEHSLPPGLFPKNITHFQFDENTRKITVTMPDDNWVLNCKSCVLRFSKTVTGVLNRGKLSEINGMKTDTRKISCIEIRKQSERELLFTTDRLSFTKSFLEFENVEDGRSF